MTSPAGRALNLINRLLNGDDPGCPKPGCLGECPMIDVEGHRDWLVALVCFWNQPLPASLLREYLIKNGFKVHKINRVLWENSSTGGTPDIFDDAGRDQDGVINYEIIFSPGVA